MVFWGRVRVATGRFHVRAATGRFHVRAATGRFHVRAATGWFHVRAATGRFHVRAATGVACVLPLVVPPLQGLDPLPASFSPRNGKKQKTKKHENLKKNKARVLHAALSPAQRRARVCEDGARDRVSMRV